MPVLFLYILKLSCSLTAIWLFYRLLLRDLTFYHLNRWYMLGYSLLSFLIPLIDVGPALRTDRPDEPLVLHYIPAISNYSPVLKLVPHSQASGWTVWTIVSGLLFLGTLFMLVRIVVRWQALRQLRRSATLVRGGKWEIYQVDEPITPFSFGSAIYINRELHTEKEWEEIILHEYAHVRGRHTFDILFAEGLTVLNWYNPFAWLIRHSIRQNLEFIADRKVLAGGLDKKEYQYHLLKVVGQPRYQLANNFNFSSLKKRIVMMNKLRSARLHLVKFLFILPLLAVLLLAFRDRYSTILRRSHGPVYVNAAGIVIALPDRTPLAGVTIRESSTGMETTTDDNGFYKLRIPVKQEMVRVHFDYIKDGYERDERESRFASLTETTGIVDIATLVDKTKKGSIFVVAPHMKRWSPDPTYEDAQTYLKETYKANEDLQRNMALQKAHPDVALFYTFEGRHRELVVHADGSAERYGYPGGATLTDMEKKYGELPGWVNQDDPGAGSAYLARWADISARAEKGFQTTNPTARAVIFPGDSRVIAVDASGKARVYDMDNDAPEERPAFEQEYGKLPDCVPAAGNHPASRWHSPKVDTVPAPQSHSVTWSITGRDSLGHIRWGFGNNRYMRIENWDARNGDSMHKPGRDTIPAFGNDTLRADFSQRSRQEEEAGLSKSSPLLHPLFVIDGIERDTGVLRTLNPATIESIAVLKDSTAIARYGPRGKNGVVLIKTKFLTPPRP